MSTCIAVLKSILLISSARLSSTCMKSTSQYFSMIDSMFFHGDHILFLPIFCVFLSQIRINIICYVLVLTSPLLNMFSFLLQIVNRHKTLPNYKLAVMCIYSCQRIMNIRAEITRQSQVNLGRILPIATLSLRTNWSDHSVVPSRRPIVHISPPLEICWYRSCLE